MHNFILLFLGLVLINSISLTLTTRFRKDERGRAILYKTSYFEEYFMEIMLVLILSIIILLDYFNAHLLVIVLIGVLFCTALIKLILMVYLDKKY